MSEYGWSIEYLMSLSRGQLILFCDKIAKRKKSDSIFQAKLHNAYKNPGLNTDGAVAIEDVIDEREKMKKFQIDKNNRFN